MEVILASHAGYCFGVKRAVDMVYELTESNETGSPIYTLGPIIHNETVVKDLETKGVKVISEDDIASLNEGTVVIRAHGVPKDVCDALDRQKVKYIDGTCPFVKRIHNIVSEASNDGDNIIIIGSAKHPEVLGIKGWAEGKVTVIESKEEAIDYCQMVDEKVTIVSQTTFNPNKFQELVEIIRNKGYNVNVVDTICNATKERQESADEIASRVDAMIVIGGRNSSNTQKLYDICKARCDATYFVETVEDIDFVLPKAASLVGITAGASTPNKIIEEVQNYVRINF